MPIVFDSLNLQQARAYLEPVSKEGVDLKLSINKRLYDGDHWLDGEGWVGPRPDKDHPQYQETMAMIAEAFASANAVKEVVERHAAGVIGHEPDWGLTVRRSLADGDEPNEQEQALIAEAHAALTSWWDRVQAHQEVRELVQTALWAKRAVLRIFVPPDEVDPETGIVLRPPATLEEALELVWPDRPEVGSAAVGRHRRSMRDISVYVYTEEDKAERVEISYLDPATKETVLRILGVAGEGETGVIQETRLPLGGQLLAHELRVNQLITEQVRSNQKHLNKAKSMMGRNSDLGGFLERTVLNGQMPDDENMKYGAGITNFIAGLEVVDRDGKKTILTPSIVYRDPVPVDTFTDTEDGFYRSILRETHQMHALISGDATASGESRKQARADFESSLEPTASQVNALGRWLIETVLAMAAYFMGQPERYAGLRATFECRVDAGPLSSEEQNTIITQNDKELLSTETAMSLLGRDDPDAELQRIRTEKEADLQLMGPIQQVQLQRQQLSLERDRQAQNGPSEEERLRQQLLATEGGEA